MDLLHYEPPGDAMEAMRRILRRPTGGHGSARAYVNWGRWVADCPREPCTNAIRLGHGQTMFECINCGAHALVEWPAGPILVAISQTLSLRPVPATRNWYPKGHPLAVRHGLPDGQSVADLMDENIEHGVPIVVTCGVLEAAGQRPELIRGLD